MVVDDSAVVRGLIAKALQSDPQIVVAASAGDGEQAVRKVHDTPVDIVLLDIEMPVMDGLTALPLILAARPGVRVIMVSSLTQRMAHVSLDALKRGASDYVPKPEGSLVAAEAFKQQVIAKVRALGGARAGPAAAAPTPALAGSGIATRPPPLVRTAFQAIAIGGSTGGPAALMTVFAALRNVRQPIFVTQHMPAAFTAALAEHLARISAKTCAEARDGEPPALGRVYVAPGDWHMTLARDGALPVIRLTQDAPEHFCRPAVDPMLRSLAKVYGPSLLTVILTGMGSDGAAGCQAAAAAGGRLVVQDEASSVVWGMPGAAARTGLAEEVLPLKEIGPWICKAAGATA